VQREAFCLPESAHLLTTGGGNEIEKSRYGNQSISAFSLSFSTRGEEIRDLRFFGTLFIRRLRNICSGFNSQIRGIILIYHIKSFGIKVGKIGIAKAAWSCYSVFIVLELDDSHSRMRITKARPHHMYRYVQKC